MTGAEVLAGFCSPMSALLKFQILEERRFTMDFVHRFITNLWVIFLGAVAIAAAVIISEGVHAGIGKVNLALRFVT